MDESDLYLEPRRKTCITKKNRKNIKLQIIKTPIVIGITHKRKTYRKNVKTLKYYLNRRF